MKLQAVKLQKRIFVFLFLVLSCIYGVKSLSEELLHNMRKLKSTTPDHDQAEAVQDLISRLIPQHSNSFDILVNNSYFDSNSSYDIFEVSGKKDGKICVVGTTGYAAAAGVYDYLKYWCGCHVSWSSNQLQLPAVLPKVQIPFRKKFQDRFRYYQNVCTVSYSMAFWNWTRWENEIDWMALNGINLPLAFTGQETIWQKVYEMLSLTQKELSDHFGGPAFLAWQRMGNVEGWGGPLPRSWYVQQQVLQCKILKRMRSFGMIPVLPGFAGHVPKALVSRVYPKTKYYKLNSWNHFSGRYGETYLLDPQDPLFQRIGKMFIDTQRSIYNGTEHIYNVDVFNEMQPPKLTVDFISDVSRSIYGAMKTADVDAVWLMQAWMFNDAYWTDELMQAWFKAIPYGNLILLDVGSELNFIYLKTKGFFGYPFIWTMIENFGGGTRLFGQLSNVSAGILKSRQKFHQNMVGIGMTPEGIEQNHVNFELVNEMGWRNEPIDFAKWGYNYLRRRYGSNHPILTDISNILYTTVYDCKMNIANDGVYGRPVVMRPRVMKKIIPHMWYNPNDLKDAWQMMFFAIPFLQNSSLFVHDIVKVGTQVLEDFSIIIYDRMMESYFNNTLEHFKKYSNIFTELLTDMDRLLSSEQHSLLGKWIYSAKQLGHNDAEKALLEYNARNQVTLWGPNGEVLDYANKNWGGLIEGYYLPRWQLFVDMIIQSIVLKQTYNQTAFNQLAFEMADTWTKSRNSYPVQPVGDAFHITDYLYHKYKLIQERFGIDTDAIWKQVISYK